jgi:purine-binding chemotaxis protein CheW
MLCRVGARLCILPLSCVVETMRPQPVEAVVGAPPFVSGLAVIRGLPTPVVDARRLLGADEHSPPTRFVTLKVGARSVALAVDAVIGIRPLAGLSTDALPPLLGQTDGPASAVGAVDRELLQVLQEARLIPAAVWAVLEQHQVPS